MVIEMPAIAVTILNRQLILNAAGIRTRSTQIIAKHHSPQVAAPLTRLPRVNRPMMLPATD
jgi:hypothetical protein